jgi:hypothetical protein
MAESDTGIHEPSADCSRAKMMKSNREGGTSATQYLTSLPNTMSEAFLINGTDEERRLNGIHEPSADCILY